MSGGASPGSHAQGDGGGPPLQMLVGLARAIAQARTDPAAIVEVTTRTLVKDFVDGSAAHLKADFNVRAYAHRDILAEEFLRESFAGMPLELLPAGRVIASGRPVFHAHLPTDFADDLPPELRAYVRRFAIASVIIVPIRADDAVVGALSMWRDDRRRPFCDDDLNTAHVCAEHVGLALEHAIAFRALQDRETRFELAARATQEVLWDWDIATGRVFWGDAIYDALGWRRDQVRPTFSWWADNIHEAERERVLAEVERAIRDNPDRVRWRLEYRFRRGDGGFAHIIDRGFVQRDEDGRLRRLVGSMQDVSERVEVSERLKRREESYRAFVAGSGEAIWCLEGDDPVPTDLPPDEQIDLWYERWRLGECNDAMARMYGYERADELRGAPIDLLFPRDDPRLREFYRAFIAGGYRLVDVEDADHAGGQRRFLSSLVGTVEDGRLRRAWGTRREVTDLARQAAALARYQLMSQHGRDIFLFVRGDDGRIIEANDAAVAAYGYSRDELLRLRLADLRAEGAPREDADGGLTETTHRRKDGTTFPVEVSSRGADVHGERVLLSVVRDITERRRTEAAAHHASAILQAVCDNTPDLVFAKDVQGRMVFANPAAIDAIGKPAEAVLGRRDAEFMDFGVGQHISDNDQRVLASGRSDFFEERGPDGRIFLSSKTPYRDATGAIVGLIGISMDITDRKQAEVRLRKTQEALSLVLRAGHMGTWMLDPGTDAAWLSRELEDILGLTAGAAGESSLYAAVHPDDRAYLRAEIEAAVADRRDYRIEFRFVRADTGAVGWMEGRGRAVYDESGRTTMIYGIGIDVTQRKQAELDLRESEQLFARAFGKNPNPMTVNELPGGEYLEVNEAAIKAHGFPREEMLGKTPLQLGVLVDAEDVERFNRLLARRAPVRDLELRLRSKAGRVHSVLMSAELIEYRKRPCVLTVAVDVSARKRAEWALLESEERFRQIAATIDEAFWLMEFSPYWRFVYVSPGWEHAWRRSPEELYGDPTLWTRAIHPDDRAAAEDSQRDLVTGAVDSRDLEYRVVRPDGAVQWIRDRGTLIRDAAGRPWRAAGIAEDITERKLAERERERLVSDLQVAIAVRDDFLSVASHELRTPLTALGFHLEHLVRLVDRGEHDSGVLARKVDGAIRQIERVTALVDSLIHVSRMSLGRLSLELTEFDLVGLVRDLVARAEPDAQRARCEIRVDAPPELRGAWDRKQLDQALHNLLANALKYGAGRPVDVRVFECGPEVAIEVQDRGIGIAEEDRPRIFDRFERAVSSAHYGGFGLGLYIARRIVEAHGGVLDVTSTPGQGSTFRLQLPRQAAQP
ncbi:PAS domain S-box-containing protein [Nannocystis exedens]|uniref:histidine kinase n=1 Tax=Nannocystis exedens TaxID=54 RepID=A0A1I2ATW2_9BACT|nr:PAS domain S-box protein [Nannocystis exedens]PCC74254.1 sensor protein [Nannocystis exedens]SFE47018.1 PAS domain S-box-containing protein [Nannocystis exedens]